MKPTLQKLGRNFNRRALDRFTVPGATVIWTYIGQDFSTDETSPLSDISKSGVSFLNNTPPEVDSDVILQIHLPKEPEQFKVCGKVVYSIFRGPGLTYEYRIGVQLKPFSQTEGENTLQSLEIIEGLEQMYGKRLNTMDIEE